MTKTRTLVLSSFAAAALVVGCGGGGPNGPSSATVIVRDGGSGNSGATITITTSGVSPKSVTVSAGQAVTIVNNDTRAHEIASDPHPQHGSCPSIETGIGTLGPGASKVTHAFANAGTCSYHDHLDSGNNALRGTIVVQ